MAHYLTFGFIFAIIFTFIGCDSLRDHEGFIKQLLGRDLKDTSCVIDIKGDFNDKQPLILSTTNDFLLPTDASGKISLKKDEKIELACTDEFEGQANVKLRTLACGDGNKFIEGTQAYEFKSFKCKTAPEHTALRVENKTCFNNAAVVNVGFKVDDKFFKSFEICFDEVLERTHYVTHEFTPGCGFSTIQTPTSDAWKSTGFFNEKIVDDLYKQVNHRKVIGEILGSEEYANFYIKDGTDLFLSRGHLAARADFIFANNQRATHWLMNAAPQWQTFNGGNWNSIEEGIRSYIAAKGITADAYTGTWGTTTLLDAKFQPHEIYLTFDEKKKGLIPVPKIYYKIIVDRATNKGIVFVGVNNPYLKWLDIMKGYILCADVSDKVNWIKEYVKWDKRNITAGYSYACDVNEFIKVVTHLPNLNVTGLLNSATSLFKSSLILSFIVSLIHLSNKV